MIEPPSKEVLEQIQYTKDDSRDDIENYIAGLPSGERISVEAKSPEDAKQKVINSFYPKEKEQ